MDADCCSGLVSTERPALACLMCSRQIHLDCLQEGRPSPIAGDFFFELVCSNCGGEETVCRMRLSWQTVLQLALYNLQLAGGSKCGYFKWKEHICGYIDRYWQHLFGPDRKKAGNWHGTVAGSLSSGSPHIFISGAMELKETGWWKLAQNRPPTVSKQEISRDQKRKKPQREPELSSALIEGSRAARRRGGSLEAAIALRERRDMISAGKRRKKHQSAASEGSRDSSRDTSPVTSRPPSVQSLPVTLPTKSSHALDVDKELTSLLAKDPVFSESVHALLGGEIAPIGGAAGDQSDDLDIDPCSLSPDPTARSFDNDSFSINITGDESSMEFSMNTIDSSLFPSPDSSQVSLPFLSQKDSLSSQSTSSLVSMQQGQTRGEEMNIEPEAIHIKQEPGTAYSSTDWQFQTPDNQFASQSRPDTEDSDTDSAQDTSSQATVQPAKRKRRAKKIDTTANEATPTEENPMMHPLSLYEERHLLRQLQQFGDAIPAHARRLRRKLTVRQLKRERGMKVFDLDATVNEALRRTCALYQRPFVEPQIEHKPISHVSPTPASTSSPINILDRFQNQHVVRKEQEGASFLNRLSGIDENQLRPIHSPYTARSLKPFIRRDYESRPLKLKLLLEIQAYPHKNNPHWEPPQPPPIDYCYVQPQHIAAINTLCREFFWPAIDMSECLQYPDFSCVVLYRKCVIGFAFMVPDVTYNEAYITFIFTHPEWRRAGIARFMLYHLIQTCMGRDVTLHVSASNEAMMLYQQFGFKAEQLVLDFYDKYLPIDSTECRHAFFLRLPK